MKKSTKIMLLVTGAVLSGCASQTGWTPTVDTYNDPNAYRISQDMAECKELASHYSGGTATETAVGAGVGGLVGAAGGAALGATVGALGGAAKQGFSAEDKYKSAYNNCMSGRGHRVIR